ncbi:hypothetical protein K440DRAFT_613486 [Wilcoxina mikolae CBS 423.85]|nr:hypothetical protein K440DRAFT_613486 [Wilcoxina mikolae CBS 423.85]
MCLPLLGMILRIVDYPTTTLPANVARRYKWLMQCLCPVSPTTGKICTTLESLIPSRRIARGGIGLRYNGSWWKVHLRGQSIGFPRVSPPVLFPDFLESLSYVLGQRC